MAVRCSPELEQMVLNLFRDPAVLQALTTDPEGYFEKIGLSEEEREGLREASFTSLDRIGLHPMLRMHYLMAVNPGLGEHVTVKAYLSQLVEGVNNG